MPADSSSKENSAETKNIVNQWMSAVALDIGWATTAGAFSSAAVIDPEPITRVLLYGMAGTAWLVKEYSKREFQLKDTPDMLYDTYKKLIHRKANSPKKEPISDHEVIKETLAKMDAPQYTTEQKTAACQKISSTLQEYQKQNAQAEKLTKTSSSGLNGFFQNRNQQFDKILDDLNGLNNNLKDTHHNLKDIQSKVTNIQKDLEMHKQEFDKFRKEYAQNEQIKQEYNGVNEKLNAAMASRFGELFSDKEFITARNEYQQTVNDPNATYQQIKQKEQAALNKFEEINQKKQILTDTDILFQGALLVGKIGELMGIEGSDKIAGVASAGIQTVAAVGMFSANPIGAGLCMVNAVSILQSTFGSKQPSQLAIINKMLQEYTKFIISHIDLRADRIEYMLKQIAIRIEEKFEIMQFHLYDVAGTLLQNIYEGVKLITTQNKQNMKITLDELRKLLHYAQQSNDLLVSLQKTVDKKHGIDLLNQLQDRRNDIQKLLDFPSDKLRENEDAQAKQLVQLTGWITAKIHDKIISGENIFNDDKRQTILTEYLAKEFPYQINPLFSYLNFITDDNNYAELYSPKNSAFVNPLFFLQATKVLIDFRNNNTFLAKSSYKQLIDQVYQKGKDIQQVLIQLRQHQQLFEYLFNQITNALAALAKHMDSSRYLPIYPAPTSSQELQVDSFFIHSVAAMDMLTTIASAYSLRNLSNSCLSNFA